MFNANEFRACLARKGITQTQLAEKIGISSRTLCTKMKNGIFGTDEIEAIMSILSIKDPMPIFFAQAVTCKDTTCDYRNNV